MCLANIQNYFYCPLLTFIMKASRQNRKCHCWNASHTALPLESLPPTCARKGLTVHAGDVVLQLASLWLPACGGKAVFTWSGWSQNVYPARILHEVNSWEPVLKWFNTTVTMLFAYLQTVDWIWCDILQSVGYIYRYNKNVRG